MREIKFRRPYFKFSDDSFYGFREWGPVEHGFMSPCSINVCYHKEDQQYIGCTDKNGVEIYENDIVLTDEGGWIAKVVYHHDSFMCTGLDDTGWSWGCNWEDFEVIASVDENPELLEG